MFFRLPDWLRYEIQHLRERTGINIREWINANPRIIIGITFASVLILLVIVICMLMPEETIKVEEYKKGWFYDLNTGELFVAESDAVVPVEAPSGPLPNGRPAGVLAYVFSYVPEPNDSQRFIGFLEIPDPNFKADSFDSRLSGAKRWGQGKLICTPEDNKWVSANSKEGQAILQEFFQPNAKGEVAHYCLPE